MREAASIRRTSSTPRCCRCQAIELPITPPPMITTLARTERCPPHTTLLGRPTPVTPRAGRHGSLSVPAGNAELVRLAGLDLADDECMLRERFATDAPLPGLGFDIPVFNLGIGGR